ncbi:hypothetical protein GOC70_28575 [Sinorhizobium medicae]|nr:hypothetical protein [Sinorhizobium medicae]
MMVALLKIAAPDMSIVARAKIEAAKCVFDGRESPSAYRNIARCSHYHAPTSAQIVFTRDAGHNSSGWWKNPDYERCYHLSLSFGDYDRQGRFYSVPFDRRMGERWAAAFFGDDVTSLWVEPPYSPEGKARYVYHYRLFCDQAWKAMKPRGEVYSTDWTPAGWKSFSDLHGDRP